LVPGYVGAGAQVLVVSGVVDVRAGPLLTSDIDLRVCLLSPDPAVLRERILARGWDEADADEAVAEAALLPKADFVDVTIDTTGLSVAETVASLRTLADGSRPSQPAPGAEPWSGADLDVVVVTGPRAVGSSTIGFGLAMRRWRAARRTGFVDLQQLGFMSDDDGRPGSETSLGLGQLAAMHRLMAARDAELLVVSGHLTVPDRAALRAALRVARVCVVQLRADLNTLREHVRARVSGSDARLAGDDLLDADQSHQDLVVERALAEQVLLDAATVDDAVLDVSDRTLPAVINDIEELRNQ